MLSIDSNELLLVVIPIVYFTDTMNEKFYFDIFCLEA